MLPGASFAPPVGKVEVIQSTQHVKNDKISENEKKIGLENILMNTVKISVGDS